MIWKPISEFTMDTLYPFTNGQPLGELIINDGNYNWHHVDVNTDDDGDFVFFVTDEYEESDDCIITISHPKWFFILEMPE